MTLNGVMVKLWPRYGDFSIFQDGAHCHLGFSNFVNFNNRKAQEGQTASPCQTSSKSVICKNRQHCIESVIAMASQVIVQYHNEIRLWANAKPNVMAALPDIGGALCSTPQSLADAHY